MASGSPITGVVGTSIGAQCDSAAMGTEVQSADVNNPFQSFCNDLATISAGNVTLAGVKTFSDNMHLAQTKSFVADGSGAKLDGIWVTPNGATLACASGGGWVVASGGKIELYGRVSKASRVAIADAASKRVGVSTGSGIDYPGSRFRLPTSASTAPNIIVLDHSHATPDAGEQMEFIWTVVSGAPGATAFEFRREDASVIAQFVSTNVPSTINIWARFEYEGGVWRLAENSGQAWDSAPAVFGVIPGASA